MSANHRHVQRAGDPVRQWAGLFGAIMAWAGLAWAGSPQFSHAPLVFHAGAGGVWQGEAPGLSVAVSGPQVEVHSGSGRLSVEYQGANPAARAGACGAAARIHVYQGNRPQGWSADEEGFDCLTIEDLFPGIDLRLTSAAGRLKSDFLVAPGARPADIRFRHQGVLATRLEPDGALVSEMAGGGLWRDEPPFAYQESGGRRVVIEAAYEIDATGLVGFRLGSYDEALPLVIDPVVTFSTLLGSAGTSSATAIAADASGFVYVAGYADSAGFPLSGALKRTPAGVDLYVAKIEPAAGRLVYATYLGGGWDDRAAAIAVDAQGNAYVAGTTTSPDFPLKLASQTKISGYRDAFLLKLDANGALAFSTYFGGTDADAATALRLAGSTVWMAGDSSSPSLPGPAGAQALNAGQQDGFLAAFTTGGVPSSVSFYGGAGRESVRALLVAGDGTLYLAGSTESPALPGASVGFSKSLSGAQDGFVARFSAGANSVLAATYLGGAGGGGATLETVAALAEDGVQNLYAAGSTPSTDFPCVRGWACTFAAQQDAFLARLSKDLSSLAWSTFLGGVGKDYANALVFEPAGTLAVAGSTTSVDFPAVAALQAGYAGGGGDAFLVRVTSDGTTVPLATCLGGSGADGANALALSADGSVELAGQSSSLGFPQKNPIQTPVGVALRMFVTRVGSSNLPSLDGVVATLGPGWAQTFAFTVSHPAGWNSIARMELRIATSASTNYACRLVFRRDTNTLELADDSGTTWKPVHIGLPEYAANSNCLLYGNASGVSTSGNSLTISAVLHFGGGFTGTRNLYMNAAGWDGATTGYVQKGSWTVTTATNQWPSAQSVSPATGGGSAQRFRFTLFDGNGGNDITRSRFIFNTYLAEAGGCSILFEHLSNYVLLAPDAGGGWLGAAQAGTAATLQNSYCRVSLAGTSSSVSGNTRTVDLDITFLAGFQGRKQIYALAADLSENGYAWLPVGEWNPSLGISNQTPGWTWIMQSGFAGPSVAVVADFTDADGADDIASARMHINTDTGTAGACSLRYDAVANAAYLLDDKGSAWLGPATPGSGTVLQNSQCRIPMTDVRASKLGSELRLLAVPQFSAAFSGARSVYLQAVDKAGATSAWSQAANLSVATTGPNHTPLAATMTPSSAMGSRQVFTLAFADPNGAADINGAQVLVNSYPFIQLGCYILLYKPGNTVYLGDDQGKNFAPVRLGTSDTAGNSQCTVYGNTSSLATAGNVVLLTLDLGFKTAFESLRYVWANVTDVGGVTGPSPTLGQYGVVP